MAKLDSKQRNQLDTKEFALPEQRAYPIHDIGHARLALALGKKYATPEEYHKIQGAVHKRYPDMGKPNGMKQPKRSTSRPYVD